MRSRIVVAFTVALALVMGVAQSRLQSRQTEGVIQ
jgi:hypothetical protein